MKSRVVRSLSVLALVFAGACSGPSADEHLARGNEYFEKSLIKEAIVEYRAGVQADNMRGDLRLKLAEAHAKNGDLPAAMREYVRAADLLPGNVTAQVKAGQLLLLSKAFEDAQARAKKALELEPLNVDALVLLGNALAGLKDLDGAIAEYQEALALNPAEEAAYANIGAIQYALKRTAEAEATFRKAVDAAPKSVNARLGLGSFLWATERAKEAEQIFKDALALEPASVPANRALGAFYMSTGRAADAEPHFKAIAAAAKTTDAVTSLADYYITVNRLDEAKTVLSDLAKNPEAFAAATTRLAAIEAAQSNRPRAHELVRTVLDQKPKFVPARLLSLRLLLADARNDEAMKAAVELTRDEPGSRAAAEAFVAIGAIETDRDRTDDAIKAFEEALKIDPRSMPAALGLTRATLAGGDLNRAETHARQALALQPGNPIARSVMVRVELARGNVDRAAAELAQLEKAYPNSHTVMNLSAARHLIAGRAEAARKAYERVALANPADMEALQGLISAEVALGRKKDAVDRVDAALKRLTPTAGLYILAARTYAAAGDPKRAEEALKKALDVEPHRLAAYGMLGGLYVSQNRLPDAKDQFVELVKRNPKSVSANTMLGMILEAQRDLPAAEAQYQKTLAVDPEAAVAANNLAWLFVASGRNLEQARQLATTALKQLPDNPQVNDTLGWIYYKTGQYSQAAKALDHSIQRDKTDPTVYYHLGMTYLKLDEPAKAKQALEKALAMNPNFEGAAEAKGALSAMKR